jgi:hypothetical protein
LALRQQRTIEGVTALLLTVGVTVAVSLLASWTALVGRYWPLRRPFATPRTRRLAILIIVLTAVISTVAGLFVPKVVGMIPPYAAGLAPPALMVVPSVANRNRNQFKDNSAVIRAWATLFIAVLLATLDRLLAEQRDQFARSLANDICDEPNVVTRVEEFYRRLERHQEETVTKRAKAQSPDISAYYDSFVDNLDMAERTDDDEERAKYLFHARFAVEDMLRVAYDWRAESIVLDL